MERLRRRSFEYEFAKRYAYHVRAGQIIIKKSINSFIQIFFNRVPTALSGRLS